MKQSGIFRSIFLGIALAGAACSPAQDAPGRAADTGPEAPQGRFRVFAASYPLQYFTERVGGAGVVVTMPAGVDDPAFWVPTPEQIAAAQSADLIVLNGAGHEKWARTATLPASRVIDTTAALGDRLPAEAGAVTHSHGPEAEHSHGEVAFTTWLDMRLAVEQARAIAAALAVRLPDPDAVAANMDALETDLQQLDRDLRAIGQRAGGRPILASHPVYQYLGHAYELDIESLHLEPGQELTAADRADLTAASERGVEVILWEAEPPGSTRSFLDQLGIATVVFLPLGAVPDSDDWLASMQDNIARLNAALQENR